MPERTITSVGDLISALREDFNDYPGAVWYRGHAKTGWPLLPGYIRKGTNISEGTLISRFRQSAAMLTDRLPRDSFDWLFLMQHYGVPTRLLDWTESPLVALYFALNDAPGDVNEDGALWCLKPTELNKNANIVDENETNYIPSFEDDELKGYSYESLKQNRRIKLTPVATIATRNNARIQSQLGSFTIHHNDETPIEDVGDKSHVIKYTIPAESRDPLKGELKILGISRFSIFPEMASIGTIIKESMK